MPHKNIEHFQNMKLNTRIWGYKYTEYRNAIF